MVIAHQIVHLHRVKICKERVAVVGIPAIIALPLTRLLDIRIGYFLLLVGHTQEGCRHAQALGTSVLLYQHLVHQAVIDLHIVVVVSLLYQTLLLHFPFQPFQLLGQVAVKLFVRSRLSGSDIQTDGTRIVTDTIRSVHIDSLVNLLLRLLATAQEVVNPGLRTLPQCRLCGLSLANHLVTELAHLQGFLTLDVANKQLAGHVVVQTVLHIVHKILHEERQHR